MADSDQIRTELTALVQGHVSGTLQNTLFDRMPLLYMLFAKDGDKTGPTGLGVPKTSVFLSGVQTAKAKKETILSSREYFPFVQTALPDVNDGKVMGMYDTVPERTDWTNTSPSTYFTRPRVKWVERADPYSVPNKDIRVTTQTAKNEIKAWEGITSLFNAETTSVMGVHLDWWSDVIWGNTGTGAPADEDATVWSTLHSIRNALRDDNIYCGVDRQGTGNSYWQGKFDDTARQADFENLINYANYDLELSKKGMGLDLMLCNGTLFKKAKKEAKAKGGLVINDGGIPDFGKFGFKRELVKIDNTWIVYDPGCPAGDVVGLNLGTWTFAVHPDANFKVSEPFDMSKVKGGEDAQVGHVRTEVMLVCENPAMNVYFDSVA